MSSGNLARNCDRTRKVTVDRQSPVAYNPNHDSPQDARGQVCAPKNWFRQSRLPQGARRFRAHHHQAQIRGIRTLGDLRGRRRRRGQHLRISEQRQGRIEMLLEAQKTNVFADGNHLLNVFTNLIENANKYSPENPIIQIRTWNESDLIVISFTDNGIGMSKDIQKRIFETFYRATSGNIHDVKGFGLGLSYVKAIVESHEGSIEVISEPNKGSVFILRLPLYTN